MLLHPHVEVIHPQRFLALMRVGTIASSRHFAACSALLIVVTTPCSKLSPKTNQRLSESGRFPSLCSTKRMCTHSPDLLTTFQLRSYHLLQRSRLASLTQGLQILVKAGVLTA